MIPSHDPDYGDLGPAFPPWPGPGKDAILQPPKPDMTPSPRVLERAAATGRLQINGTSITRARTASR